MSTALVTGASSGIGRELARLLSRDGHDVILVARREEELRDLARELGGAKVLAIDLADPHGVDRVVREFPDVDILVNNAGVGDFGSFATSDRERAMTMIELNNRALVELSHAYVAGMVQRHFGRILNVASTASFQPTPTMAVYGASKAFVLSFSEALAEELRGSGVTVTALCPGPTKTEFQAVARMQGSRIGRVSTATADGVAEVGYNAMLRGEVIAVVGKLNRFLVVATRFTPRPVVRRLARRVMGSAR